MDRTVIREGEIMNFRGSREVQWRSYRNTVFIHDIFRKLKKSSLFIVLLGWEKFPFYLLAHSWRFKPWRVHFLLSKAPFYYLPQNVYFYFFPAPNPQVLILFLVHGFKVFLSELLIRSGCALAARVGKQSTALTVSSRHSPSRWPSSNLTVQIFISSLWFFFKIQCCM